MTYFELKPEVAGGSGPTTTGDLKARPPRLVRFNYEFDVWPGDALIEAISSYIVTDALKERLIEVHATGVTFGDVEVTQSGEFQDRYPNRILPQFSRLQVTGRLGEDDCGLSNSGDLVVSKRIMELLKTFGLSHCEVSKYDPKGYL